MKSLIIVILSVVVFAATPEFTFAQKAGKSIETAQFEVNGVCGSCKNRIENAALIKGVKVATWDKQAQLMNVTYRADKVTLTDIHKAISAIGHDTSEIKGNEEAYNKLPGCCQYRGDLEIH